MSRTCKHFFCVTWQCQRADTCFSHTQWKQMRPPRPMVLFKAGRTGSDLHGGGEWNSTTPRSLLTEQSLRRSRPCCDKAVQLHGNKTKVLSDLSLLKLRKASIRLWLLHPQSLQICRDFYIAFSSAAALLITCKRGKLLQWRHIPDKANFWQWCQWP